MSAGLRLVPLSNIADKCSQLLRQLPIGVRVSAPSLSVPFRIWGQITERHPEGWGGSHLWPCRGT